MALYKSDRNTVYANPVGWKASIGGSEAVLDNVLLTAVTQTATVYTAIRLSFGYTGKSGLNKKNTALTAQVKIPRVYLSLKSGWRASRWSYDYTANTCSCVINSGGEAVHTGAYIELLDIEAYSCGDTCAVTLEFLDSGKTAAKETFSMTKTPLTVRISRFMPDKLRVDMFRKPELRYGVTGMAEQKTLQLFRYIGGRTADRQPSSVRPQSNMDTFIEGNSIFDMTTGRSDFLEYELRATAVKDGVTYTDSVFRTVKMVRPRINRVEADALKDGTIRFEYDTSYVSSLWIDGEKTTDIEHGQRMLPSARRSVNMLCYGYGRYISNTIHFPFISDSLSIRAQYELKFEQASGMCESMLDWTVMGASSVTLRFSTGKERTLPHIGFLSFGAEEIRSGMSLIVKKSGLSHEIKIQEPAFSLAYPEQYVSQRDARRLISFFTPLYRELKTGVPGICLIKAAEKPDKQWQYRHWLPYYRDCMEKLRFADFFYDSPSARLTPEYKYLDGSCKSCARLDGCRGLYRLNLYLCAVLLYLSYRLLTENDYNAFVCAGGKRDVLENIKSYEKTQYFELFRRAGLHSDIRYYPCNDDMGRTKKFPDYKPMPNSFTGAEMFCFLADYYMSTFPI